VSIGNDVVDLADPETRRAHPRFDERVFRPRERALLGGRDSHHVLRWALWAAKESAYKALKRLDPEMVFSPKQFVVELSDLPTIGGQGVAEGRVVQRDHALDLRVHVDGTRLHAVARSTRVASARLLWSVERAVSDPSAAVRRLAATGIASALALDPEGIQIARRPPVALHRGRTLVTDVSLSHHGRFVAFACALAH
jgi:phosphopantetheinyl transferase (holo-ACP synthase)